jgi:hypothetical protein
MSRYFDHLADEKNIRCLFRELCLKNHPDKCKEKHAEKHAEETFKEILSQKDEALARVNTPAPAPKPRRQQG